VLSDPQGRAALLRELARANRDDADPMDEAIVRLLAGQTTRAIAGMELATRRRSVTAAALTDLSAVYLVRFEAEGDCLDLLRSLDASQRGLSERAGDSSLMFNRAVALSMLGSRMLAIAAWKRFLAHAGPGWDREASIWLRQLEQRTAEQEWARAAAVIESGHAGEAEVTALARQLPANARVHVEEVLLPRWADTLRGGDVAGAERLLRVASTIADVLASERGEYLLADAIARIRQVMASGSVATREALLDGLSEFGRGVAQYNEQNMVSAVGPLRRAARGLERADNPLRYWARFYLSIGQYYADADSGLVTLDSLLAEIPQARYPALTGRIEWIAGTIDKVQGRIQASIRRYDHAAATLRQAGGETACAFVAVLLAESYTAVGEHALAWQNRLAAFRRVPYAEGPRRNVAMWIEAKEALLRQGDLRLARPLVDEAVRDADRWGRPLGRVTAYLERAAYWLEAGDRPAAKHDLDAARTELARMEGGPLKQLMEYQTLLKEGLYARSEDPARAAALLARGLSGLSGTGNEYEAITYTTAKASAELAAGQVDTAVASLEHAITLFETVRATVEDPVSRMQAFRQAQGAFDALIKLRASSPVADREEAFLLSERARARVLLELRGRSQGALASPAVERFATLRDLEGTLPAGTTLASYTVLDDRILVWVAERGRSRLVSLRGPRGPLLAAIDRLRLEMTRGADERAIQQATAPLYDGLIRPLDLPAGDGRLIVVPDRWLARVPFAVLFDRDSGRYLVEQRIVTMVPSATLLLRGTPRPRPGPSGAIAALVVGAPGSASFRGRYFPSLPHAAEEARSIAALYHHPTLLVGPLATREKFLGASVSSDVVHFAGHAAIDVESPRRSALLFEGVRGVEPLTLDDLFRLGPSSTRLVVLSACRAQDSMADDREGLFGLAGAFFAAGVPEVVASPWDVDDRAAVPVMVAFHRAYLRRGAAGRAFREAVQELRRSGAPEARSPSSWGGFTVIEGLLD
jgi:CHAT domain-containing protein